MSDKSTLRRLLLEHGQAQTAEKAIIIEETIINLFDDVEKEAVETHKKGEQNEMNRQNDEAKVEKPVNAQENWELTRAAFLVVFKQLRDAKPNDRSDIDRAYAVTLTEVEKAFAYFDVYARPIPEP